MSSDDRARMISIQRPVYNCDSFDDNFNAHRGKETETKKTLGDRLRSGLQRTCCRREVIGHRLLGLFPVIGHLKGYRWRQYFPHDLIAGLSAGVIHVPQGMGFALLAGLPPVYGLYSSFFPGLFYYVFGTSRHLSFGTMALTALMVGTVVSREYPLIRPTAPQTSYLDLFSNISDGFNSSADLAYQNDSSSSIAGASEEDVSIKLSLAVSVTLMAGVVQLLMRICNLGMLTTYMSMPFIGSFMAGSAFQIMVSQLPFVLGVRIRRPPSTFQLPLTLFEIARNIPSVNLCALVTSIISIAFLIGIKEGVNERCKARMKIPVPAELILVVLATIVAHFAQLKDRYHMSVVGKIPTGFPPTVVPAMTNFTNYIADAVIMAVIGFAIAITMAQLMARRNQYEIDANQEILAYSIVNIATPFFGCFMSTQAPPRTMVHEATGCKTQMSGFVSIILPLLVTLWIGPLFQSLPTSVLGCIVICSMVPLMKQFADLGFMWRVNRLDFIVWVATFASTTLIGVTFGLLTGIAINVFTLVINAQLAKGYRALSAKNTEIYYRAPRGSKDPSGGHDPREVHLGSRICVFRFECGEICFANVASFKRQLYETVLDPTKKITRNLETEIQEKGANGTGSRTVAYVPEQPEAVAKPTCDEMVSDSVGEGRGKGDRNHQSDEKCGDQQSNEKKALDASTGDQDHEKQYAVSVLLEDKSCKDGGESTTDDRMQISHVVIDCSSVCYVDLMGLGALKQIVTDYRSVGSTVVLAGCNDELRRKLKVFGLTRQHTKASDGKTNDVSVEVYPTVHDAVVCCMYL